MIEFIAHPWGGNELRLGEVLERELKSGDYDQMHVATAYATGKGVEHLLHMTEPLRSGGGILIIYLGIDGDVTTKEALDKLIEAAVPTWVVHNAHGPPQSIFHPKIYFLKGRSQTVIISGSGNLTAGGLFTNYEACVLVKTSPADGHGLAREANAFFASLRGHARKLTRRLLGKLENRGALSTDATWSEPVEADRQKRSNVKSIFGEFPVRRAPPIPSVGPARQAATATGQIGVRDTMIQDVNPLNASIYLSEWVYVGGRLHMSNPTFFAPYFTQECINNSLAPRITQDGISSYSRVLHVVEIPLRELRRLDGTSIDDVVPKGPQRTRWKRGVERIIARERDETFEEKYDPHRLYFLSSPHWLERKSSIKKEGYLPQINHGFGTAFNRLDSATKLKDLKLD